MATFGGMSPFPRRYGGGRPRVQIILETLNSDRGTAYDASDTTTTVYVENMAIARAISATWGTNRRLGTLWVPASMSDDVLSRWEKMLNISPSDTDTETARRTRVEAVMSRVGQPANNGYLNTVLSDALDGAFVAVELIDYSLANITVPDGSYPWGSVVAGYPWSSTTAHILVRLQKPAGWSENQFYDAAAKVFPLLDSLLPAWCTVGWYRPGPLFVSLPGGPSGAGFYLDDDHNLDNEILAS